MKTRWYKIMYQYEINIYSNFYYDIFLLIGQTFQSFISKVRIPTLLLQD